MSGPRLVGPISEMVTTTRSCRVAGHPRIQRSGQRSRRPLAVEEVAATWVGVTLLELVFTGRLVLADGRLGLELYREVVDASETLRIPDWINPLTNFDKEVMP